MDTNRNIIVTLIVLAAIALAVFAVFRMSGDNGSFGDDVGDGIRETTGEARDTVRDATD
ncbi:MAG TPA: FeoB-associated Cys-rich membrane protein [Planctomycetota bacterium]|nr:FeoB-associated Cys-rich membrane protein [Planctomycetota bacterium]